MQRVKLVDQVIQRLQESISMGHFKAGERLPPEHELMVQLGVGRSTLREAVQVLVKAGLLEVRQGDGTYVLRQVAAIEPLEQRLGRATILEVYEVRRVLEMELAKLAALHRSEDDLAKMRQYLQQRREAKARDDKAGFVANDIAFHAAIAAAGRNSILNDLFVSFSNALSDALAKLISDSEAFENQIAIHEEILEAIAKGDAAAAQYWTAENLDRTTNLLRKLLG